MPLWGSAVLGGDTVPRGIPCRVGYRAALRAPSPAQVPGADRSACRSCAKHGADQTGAQGYSGGTQGPRASTRRRRYLVLIRLPFVKHTLASSWEGDASVREALLPGGRVA